MTALAWALIALGTVSSAWGYHTAKAPDYDDAPSLGLIFLGAICIGSGIHVLLNGGTP